MRCPSCDTDGAYVGLSTVECVNAACKHALVPLPEGIGVPKMLLSVVSKVDDEAVKRLAKMIDEMLASAKLWKEPLFLGGGPLVVEDLKLPTPCVEFYDSTIRFDSEDLDETCESGCCGPYSD